MSKRLSCVVLLAALTAHSAVAQSPPLTDSTPPATSSSDSAPLKPEEIDQLVAPIALYPDALLSQVLMAATYPIEVVSAQRWTDAHKDLKDDALAVELEKQSWDPSVKSLVNTPQVLQMMSEKLDWTVALGDAFVGQQKDVMDAVQRLRAKANQAGNLKSTNEQKVSFDNTVAAGVPQTIVIEQANPQVIYVPSYDPTVIYGAWPYPAYPPYYWYPPYYRPGPGIWYGAGFACGVAWGYAWGHCDWHHDNINININQNININKHINRNVYQANYNKVTNANFNRTNNNVLGASNNAWQHDPSHRAGVPYGNTATAQKYGRVSATGTRDAYRGFTSNNTYNTNRGGYTGGAGPAGGRPDYSRQQNPNLRSQPSAVGGTQNRYGDSDGYSRQQNYAGTRSGAYSGAGSGGSSAWMESSRGAQSRGGSASVNRGGGGGGAARRR